MSEKVKLTKEQAEAIEVFLDDNGNDKEHLVDWFVANRDYRYSVDLEYRALANLNTSILSKALYIGYEVEETFKAGDKVVITEKGNEIFTLSNPLVGQPAWFFMANSTKWAYEEDLRLATPEEIYWLETLGREKVGDFRIGDVYIDNEGEPQILEKDRHVDLAKDWYAAGDFKGIFPTASFKISTFN